MPLHPNLRGPAAALIVLSALLAGCSNSSSSNPLASGTIDSAGGTVTVSSGTAAGTSVQIPANALSTATDIAIWSDSTTSASERRPVSSASRFEPENVALAAPATLTLVITSTLPAGTVEADLVVAFRNVNGMSGEMAPTSVDFVANTVTMDTSNFGVFWVDLKTEDFIPATSYMSFNNGARYEYSNNINMVLELSSTQPNFGGANTWVMSFAVGASLERYGFYLSNSTTIGLQGIFDTAQSVGQQAIPDNDLIFLPNLAKLGAANLSDSMFSGYSPFGSTTPTVRSQWFSSVTVVSQGTLSTPAGQFNDVIEVEIMESFGSTVRTDRIWFARNVGPVQIALEGTPIGALTSRS